MCCELFQIYCFLERHRKDAPPYNVTQDRSVSLSLSFQRAHDNLTDTEENVLVVVHVFLPFKA
jgi:hypothetical protein